MSLVAIDQSPICHDFSNATEAILTRNNFISCPEESSQESFKPTKDGKGWTFGEDIDVSVDEGDKKSNDAQEEEEEIVPLEVQLGKGEAIFWVGLHPTPNNRV